MPGRVRAADNPEIVPVEFASFHDQTFKNDYLQFMNVTIPSGQIAAYHSHTKDFAQVYMAVSDAEGTPLGGKPVITPRKVGEVLFTNYTKKPIVHQVANVGASDFRIMGFELFDSEPGRFSPQARPEPYISVMDNHRVQAWRLILQPGQVAPAMTQAAPGVRIVVQGGMLVEGVQGKPDHKLNLKYGDFAWQNTGPVRTMRNVGTSTVELVEFELK
ncbi:hypothetical protein G8O24_12620 [Bradyrhizobium sp. INPA01-394B]|uniref:Cupin domain-containing protein n=1 Tax=Bradyrhizobium campsiandrae TaxID=1729892 RepID=A0ABR7U952_9BRAD|nr:hypothetical protein [Bradyrhizobium campsiandrae]MBC9878186.1 hypothetical protein [Bradyrhizobium campsiandrae]MBC9980591.1 hypothetical protein [Bradyrhizobium campsiandrae]